MKKLKIIFAVCTVLSLVGCTKKVIDSSENIPSRVSNIEFWNGGICIRKYSNASIRIIHTLPLFRSDIDYLIYEIQTEKGIEKIVDSEGLSIVFSE